MAVESAFYKKKLFCLAADFISFHRLQRRLTRLQVNAFTAFHELELSPTHSDPFSSFSLSLMLLLAEKKRSGKDKF